MHSQLTPFRICRNALIGVVLALALFIVAMCLPFYTYSTTPWWGDNAEDQIVAQFDVTADTANPYDFTYTEANKAIVDERGGMLLVGYGYKLTKVTFSK